MAGPMPCIAKAPVTNLPPANKLTCVLLVLCKTADHSKQNRQQTFLMQSSTCSQQDQDTHASLRVMSLKHHSNKAMHGSMVNV